MPSESMPFETAKQRKKRKGTGRSEDGFQAMTELKQENLTTETLPKIPPLDEDEFPKMKKLKKKYSEKDANET